MLGFFTDPYPDEILYSICARYHHRARNGSAAATVRDLFGCEALQIAVDLPSHLGSLVERLPPGHRYTVDRLIDEHTLLPFYAPFLPPERAQQLRSDMAGAPEGGSIHGRAGFLTSNIFQEFLRFCPACVEEDERLYGEAYWHRIHQVPGVMVCPSHMVFIENSDIRMSTRGKKEAPVTATQAIKHLQMHYLNTENRDHMAHLRIARDAAWLLRQRGITSELVTHQKRYLVLLCRHSLATYTGIVHVSELQTKLQEQFSEELLSMLSSDLRGRIWWLRRLVQAARSAQHPIRHLLLISALELSVKEFLQLPIEIAPFGMPPFPCLNPAAEHYGEERIMKYEVRYKGRGSREPAGTFWCDCGFIYRRFGQDEAGERRHMLNRIMAFGDVWEDKLRRMYKENRNDLKGMAQRLGVSSYTITNQAKRLGLLRDDQHKELARLGQPKRRSTKATAKRAVYRAQWLQTVRAHRTASRTEIARKAISAYHWLIRHDKQWLEEHSPLPLKPKGPPGIVDWLKRDEGLAARVRDVAEEMRNASGRPVRVSKLAVARQLGITALVFKGKIPRTSKTLEEIAESVEDYAVRRIMWAVDCFLQEKMHASRSKLMMRASLSRNLLALPSVHAALDAAFETLDAASARGWK